MLPRDGPEDTAGFCGRGPPDPIVPERGPADQLLFVVALRAGSFAPVALEGLPTLVPRSRPWRSRSDRLGRLTIPLGPSWERVTAEVSCLGPAACVCPAAAAVFPDEPCAAGADELAPLDGLDFAVSDCGVYRKTRGPSARADAEEPPTVEDRVQVFELLLAGGSTRLAAAVSFRRAARRSDSDTRPDSEPLGEEARGRIVSILVPSVGDEDLAMLPVPS